MQIINQRDLLNQGPGGTSGTAGGSPYGPGASACPGGYKPATGEGCNPGFLGRSINGEMWCCPDQVAKTSPAAATPVPTTTAANQTFQWSPDYQTKMDALLNQAGSILNYPAATSPKDYSQLTTSATTAAKAPLAGNLRGIRDFYARSGLGGGGAQGAAEAGAYRDVNKEISDIVSKLAIDEAQKRFERTTGAATTAAGLLNTVGGAQTTAEQLNAARRGEGVTATNQLLQLYSMLFGASTGGYNNVTQAITNRIGGQTQSSSMADWLPYLIALQTGGG